MPLYEYQCQACSQVTEVIQSFSAVPLRKCESCGGRLVKLISRGGFVLKGGGWYSDSYQKPSKSGGSDSGESASTEAPAPTTAPAAAAGSTESAPATKAEKPAPAKAPAQAAKKGSGKGSPKA